MCIRDSSYDIESDTLEKIKDLSKKTVISQWFEDHLADTGPDFASNRKKLLKYDSFVTSNFITTHPSTLDFLRKKKNSQSKILTLSLQLCIQLQTILCQSIEKPKPTS